jgi:hypothetical protein
MAPNTIVPSTVELHGPEIAKPQPLRIIKRSQTVSGSSTPREIVRGGRGSSGSSDRSCGSPPYGELFGVDRPLTVNKIRKGRGTVLDGTLEEAAGQTTLQNAISDLARRYSGESSFLLQICPKFLFFFFFFLTHLQTRMRKIPISHQKLASLPLGLPVLVSFLKKSFIDAASILRQEDIPFEAAVMRYVRQTKNDIQVQIRSRTALQSFRNDDLRNPKT